MTRKAQVIPFQAASRRRRCPICGGQGADEYRPFCSARCADADLGRWLGGSYRIPTDEQPETSERPPDETD